MYPKTLYTLMFVPFTLSVLAYENRISVVSQQYAVANVSGLLSDKLQYFRFRYDNEKISNQTKIFLDPDFTEGIWAKPFLFKVKSPQIPRDIKAIIYPFGQLRQQLQTKK